VSDRLPPFASLRAFESAARLLSFRKAAEELHVTPSAISQQVRGLEEWLGVPLFVRGRRGLELTLEGELMLPGIREGFATFAAALGSVMLSNEAGSLAVSAPPTFASRWLVPRLQRFKAAHPEIELRLTSTMAMIDGREFDPASLPPRVDPREDVVASIRYGEGHYAGARVDRIFHASYVPICSPRLLAGKNALRALSDLRHHTLIHDDTIPDERARPNWEQLLRSKGLADVDARRGPRFSDGSLAIDAAVDGQGVALALRPMVEAEIQAGRLAIPFEEVVPSGYGYYLVTPEESESRAPLPAFRSWLLKEAASVAA
jgi:LysR family glycine cleavage system transcriptional activator